jgi:hypothetical protein
MASRISQLVLKCRDLEPLARFWCEILDFVELDREEGVYIEVGWIRSERRRRAHSPFVSADRRLSRPALVFTSATP